MSDRTTSTAGRENRARDELTALLAVAETRRTHFQELLPSEIPWDVFKDTFKIAIQRSPKLLEADRQSLWIALQKAAMDGLKPDGREGALVIFGDDSEDDEGKRVASAANRPKQVQWMPMVAGLIKLVRNTGEVTGIRAKLVYKGERVEITDEDGVESYKHVRVIAADSEINDDPANIVGGYAVVNYKDGTWEMEPMSRAQIDRVRAVSRAKKGPWLPWYDEMAKKTILRRLIKRLEKSSVRRLEAALDRDDTLTIDGAPEPPASPPSRGLGAPASKKGAPERPIEHLDQDQNAPIADGPAQDPAGDRRDARSDVRDAATAPKKDQPAKEPQNITHNISEPAAADTAYFASDENGEPVDVPGGADAFDSGEAFTNWMVVTLAASAKPDSLWEANLDALNDLRVANPELHKAAYDAYMARQKKLQEPPPPTAADDEPPPPDEAGGDQQDAPDDGPATVPVPNAANGRPDWNKYGRACLDALKLLNTQVEVSRWVSANFETYQGKAIATKIEPAIKARRNEFDEAKRSDAVAQQQPAQDREAATADSYLDEIKALTTLDAGKLFGARGDVVAKMARWERERPELAQKVAEAAAKKMAELKGAV